MRAYKNEKMAEDRLKDKEYGLEYFIPKHYAVRTYHGVKSKKLVPVIPSLLFVHASHSQITEFKKRYNFLQFTMWEKSTGAEYITVPDDQMDSFIKIASHYEEDTVYYRPEEIDLKRGMRVCIHGGKFDNVKGMFVRVQGKRNRRVVVLLEGVMAVSAEVHPDLIERHLQLPHLAVGHDTAAQHTVHLTAAQLVVHHQAVVLPAAVGVLVHLRQAHILKHRPRTFDELPQVLLSPFILHAFFPILYTGSSFPALCLFTVEPVFMASVSL